MKTKFYLHVRRGGGVRATKTKVATFVDEVTIGMEVDLPDKLFQKPIIQGKVTVTEDMVSPSVLTAEVKEEIQNAIQSVEGVTIELLMPKED